MLRPPPRSTLFPYTRSSDLPRYARGKLGAIDRDHGVFVFPDTNAHFLGEKPQHVYSVRFAARELWGDEAPPRDAVYIEDRKSTRLNSSHTVISYAVFCLKKK